MAFAERKLFELPLRRAWVQEEDVLSRVLGEAWEGQGGRLREMHLNQRD